MPTEFRVTEDWQSLHLYIEYEALPVAAYAEMLLSIDGLYKSLARRLPPSFALGLASPGDTNFIRPAFWVPLFPPLIIEESRTGNSISTKISFDRNFLPQLTKVRGGDLELHLPRWSAAIIFAAMLFAWGQDRYKVHLEATQLHLENEKLRIELQELERTIKRPSEPSVQDEIDQHVGRFWVNARDPRLIEVSVNGVQLLRRG